MDWRPAMVLGGAGGAVVELITLWATLAEWQQARKSARKHRKRLPRWNVYVDPWPDALVAATRLLLGAAAGLIFHAQVTGDTAAVAVGASAPALLRQLGATRSVRSLSDTQASPTSGRFEPGWVEAADLEVDRKVGE